MVTHGLKPYGWDVVFTGTHTNQAQVCKLLFKRKSEDQDHSRYAVALRLRVLPVSRPCSDVTRSLCIGQLCHLNVTARIK